MEISAPKTEFWRGVRDEAPLLLGVAPSGVLYGALAVSSQIALPLAQAMSAIVFAGSSQLVATQMIGSGVLGLIILLVVFVINLRHALYSASIEPHLRHLKRGWKFLLAYLLTDEAYAVAINHYNQKGNPASKHWYFLGAGIVLWMTWQVSTAIGVFIGAHIPPEWPLGFTLPLTFIAVVVPSLKDRASVLAAAVAALLGVLTVGLPLKTGLLVAAAVGILSGVLAEGRQK